jgi:ribosomal protein S21
MIIKGRKVTVHDNNIEKALRKFKKQISDDGLILELQNRQQYIKPTVKKKLAKAKAKNRWKKYLASQKLPEKLF